MGAHQGPWEVHARVIVSRKNQRRVQFYSGWRAFASFYQLASAFILHFDLNCRHGVFFVKVFDSSLCLLRWRGSDDDMVPPPAQAQTRARSVASCVCVRESLPVG